MQSGLRRSVKVGSLLLVGVMLWGLGPAVRAGEAIPVIFDSDMAGDVDDVGALAVLHALADQGKARILAVGASDRNRWTPLCMDALNTYYGHPEIPIGAVKDRSVWHIGSKYAKQVAEAFPRSRDWDSAADAPDVIEVYRKMLAGQPDQSVVFVSVGGLSNASNLLKSEPDAHSALNGRELVARKVRHWVCMAGAFLEQWKEKKEANIYVAGDAARHALGRSVRRVESDESTAEGDLGAGLVARERANWPTRVSFMSYGIGRQMKTGPGLEEAPEDHPVRYAYQLHKGFKPHTSFDQAAVLYAVEALYGGSAAGYWEMSEWGWAIVREDRTTRFQEDMEGMHRYTKSIHEIDRIERHLERLMAHVPE